MSKLRVWHVWRGLLFGLLTLTLMQTERTQLFIENRKTKSTNDTISSSWQDNHRTSPYDSPSPIDSRDRNFSNKTNQLPEKTLPPKPASSSCYLNHCPNGRINKIVIKPIRREGLLDRYHVFERLSNLAGYLCATLHVASPQELLIHIHNVGFPALDPSLLWVDFADFLLLEDDSPVLFTYDNASMYGPGKSEANKAAFYRYSKLGKIISDFSDVRQYVMEQQSTEDASGSKMANITGALWVIDTPARIYDVLRMLRSHVKAAKYPLYKCQYAHRKDSATIQNIAGHVWQRLKSGRSDETVFVSLHVRRTDAVKECDTSLPTMVQYLDCSLNGTSSLTETMVILFSSDEQNVTYRQNILDIPRQQGHALRHVEVLDLDAIVLDVMHQLVEQGRERKLILNNYFLFAIIQHVQKQTRYKLVKRREASCNACDSLLDMH